MSDTRKINVDLGLVLNMEVPASMPDSEVLDLVFRASNGEGDQRLGMNLMANVNFAVQSQLEDNFNNMGVNLSINGSGLCIKPQGDTRTPRQRSLDYNKADEFTEGKF
tara:strand:- start:4998 stop:5321 length:324 start_codon:yes stop_codon:yes gene_type:complete